MEKKKYKMDSWKLSIEGEFSSVEEAIEELADRYMKCSKCDAPGRHVVEILVATGQVSSNQGKRTLETIGKAVRFWVWEKNKYGQESWVAMHLLTIHPFKAEHWWPSEGFVPPKRVFKYEIVEPENNH